jgi:hypothetical protein
MNQRGVPSDREVASSLGRLEPPLGSSRVRMLIVEDGTNGFDEHALPNDRDEAVLVTQGAGERPGDFAKMVERCISTLDEQHKSIGHSVLLLSPRFDEEATKARVSIGRSLAAHAASTRGGPSELLISAGQELDAALVVKVRALADALTSGARPAALPVFVQFASEGPTR